MSTRLRRTVIAAIAAASMAMLVLTTGTPASAGETWRGCESGNVCLYNGDITPRYLSYQTPGYVPDGEHFWVVVNNGNQQAGADHVYFEYKYYGGSEWYDTCLHFRPGDGYKLDLRDGAVNATIRNMYWGGEC
ncbi:hypothetical protein [Glycomyces buryatensis]|uniref:Peptidase inhibitor family I36 protein n=1 Tax=Glycomyces buryatensis TaxID=2570927 RepID=A0A4S8QES3_9ACTN|nr:hypothetical protein [Glycomyces buryatensis]THV42850.1 hypothetical protein FAB82_03600 [Glycomyces buryatensis]